MANTLELVMAEECTKVYKLKDRHSIILALYQKFELEYASYDRSAGQPGGGNTLLVLLYAFTSGCLGFPVIQAGLLICEHCAYLHYNIVCSSVETCLQTSEFTHRQATQDGKAITWAFLPSEVRPVEKSTGKFYPFLHCLYPRQQHDVDYATFPKLAMLNYVVGGLNSSFIPQGRRFTSMHLRSPTIGWSEDGIRMERHTANVAILHIQIYAMRSDNESSLNLKFITADGVEYKIPSLYIYSRPLAATLWLTVAVFFTMAVILVVISSGETQVASQAKIVLWSGFWIYGAFVDQVQHVSKVHAPIKRVQTILFGFFC